MTTSRHLPLALGAVLAADLLGAIVAVADHLAGLGDVLNQGSYLSAPTPIAALQVLGVLALLRASGRRRSAGAVVLLLTCTLSLAAAAFDGDVAHAGLSRPEIVLQGALVAATAALWAAAARAVALSLRGHRRLAPAGRAAR